jgi:hypothetical protein
MRCYWDEEDTWFYFEVNGEGTVTRQAELKGPTLTPLAAASLDEWHGHRMPASWPTTTGSTDSPRNCPVSEWEGHDPEPLTSDDFEKVWDSARQ